MNKRNLHLLIFTTVIAVSMGILPLIVLAAEAENETIESEQKEININAEVNVNSGIQDDQAAGGTLRDKLSLPFNNIVKPRAQALIVTILGQIKNLETRIQANEYLSEETKEKILENIQKDRTFLLEQQEALNQAQSITDARLITQRVMEYLRQRKSRELQHRSEFNERLRQHIGRMQDVGYNLVNRLQTAVEKLKEKGVDTSEVEKLIEEHKAYVDNLNNLNLNNPDEFRTVISTLRSQMDNILKKMREVIEQFVEKQQNE